MQGSIADHEEAQEAIDDLLARQLIGPASTGPHTLALRPSGEALFTPLRAAVTQTTEAHFVGIAPSDLAVTHRVLVELALRAAGPVHAPNDASAGPSFDR